MKIIDIRGRLFQLITKHLHLPCPKVNPRTRVILDSYKEALEAKLLPYLRSNNREHRNVFVNHYVNFDDIRVIGFDLDYTLVTYTVELQRLIYDLARDILISNYNFPSQLKHSTFDPTYPIRGLFIDQKNGVLCKMSSMQRVTLRSVYRGKTGLSDSEVEALYGGSRHISTLEMKTMKPLNDQYGMAEACLYADTIECLEYHRRNTGELYSASAVVDDVRAAIETVHVSGVMHSTVTADLSRYVEPSPKLPDLLESLKSEDKKLFLLTNSGFTYAEKAMSRAMGLPPSADSYEWRQLFDLISCSARKPDFYTSNRPFRRWNTETRSPAATPVMDLKKGEVYIGGSLQILHRIKPWRGKEVLYVGDNLWADLVEAGRTQGWHTACVIAEMHHEIGVQRSEEFIELVRLRSKTRQLLYYIQKELEDERRRQGAGTLEDEELHFLREVDSALKAINVEISALFNPRFGSVFRTDGNATYFASCVRRYADLYMSNVCDLLEYNPRHRFYPSSPNLMDHDQRGWPVDDIFTQKMDLMS